MEDGRPFAKSWQLPARLLHCRFRDHDRRLACHRLVYDERRRGESKTEDCAAAGLADLLTGRRDTAATRSPETKNRPR